MMYKSAEHIQGVYAQAGRNGLHQEDYEDANHFADGAFDYGASRDLLSKSIHEGLMADPLHPKDMPSITGLMGVFGAGVGGLAALPVKAVAGLIGKRMRYAPAVRALAVPVGMAIGGIGGALSGRGYQKTMRGPADDKIYRESLAAQARRKESPELMRQIADEVADEWVTSSEEGR